MNTVNSKALKWANLIIKSVALVAVLATVGFFTNNKLNELKASNASWMAKYNSSEDRVKQLSCLTRNIYWEAANEPFEGKVAVAQVTLNRLESGKFANTVCGVVQQKTVVYQKVICQFSWYCDSAVKTRAVHPELWKEAEAVAKKVLFENFRLPSMQDAMYYHADYVNPRWGKPKIAKIGRHIFYSENR